MLNTKAVAFPLTHQNGYVYRSLRTTPKKVTATNALQNLLESAAGSTRNGGYNPKPKGGGNGKLWLTGIAALALGTIAYKLGVFNGVFRNFTSFKQNPAITPDQRPEPLTFIKTTGKPEEKTDEDTCEQDFVRLVSFGDLSLDEMFTMINKALLGKYIGTSPEQIYDFFCKLLADAMSKGLSEVCIRRVLTKYKDSLPRVDIEELINCARSKADRANYIKDQN